MILSYVIFFPLLGAAALLFFGKEQALIIKSVGLLFSAATFVLSLFLYVGFDPANSSMQFLTRILWVPSLNVGYTVGIDGMSLLLIMLTTFLTPIALLSSWNSVEKRIREYTIMILLLETAMLGV